MNERVRELISEIIEDLNQTREEKIPTDNLLDVCLYGGNGVFDSMHLVSFLVQVEEALEDEFDREISLTSEKAVSSRIGPFSSVRRLMDFIDEELQLELPEPGPEMAGDTSRRG